ncbi:IS1 family transposase [Escherichia coli]
MTAFNDFRHLTIEEGQSVELHDKVIGHYLNIKHYQ